MQEPVNVEASLVQIQKTTDEPGVVVKNSVNARTACTVAAPKLARLRIIEMRFQKLSRHRPGSESASCYQTGLPAGMRAGQSARGQVPEPCGSRRQGPPPLLSMFQVRFSEIVVLSAALIKSAKATAKDKIMSDLKNRFVILAISRFQMPRKALSIPLSQPPLLDFLQRPPLSFWNPPPYKEERGYRDSCVEQKNTGGSK